MPESASSPRRESTPRLARRARLRWDAVRESHVLLLPESVLMLTATAFETLELCDGARTLEAIVDALATRHRVSPATVERDVRALIERLRGRGLIEFDGEPTA